MSDQSVESLQTPPASELSNWIHIGIDDEDIKQDMLARLESRIAARQASDAEQPSAVELVQKLRIQMLGDPAEISDSSVEMLVRRQDYDVLPRDYKIDWRFPILGPIHGVVRRLINDEITRFLFPSLKHQSSLNRQLVDAIQELADENQLLRSEITRLQELSNE